MDDLPARVAASSSTSVEGLWQRHVSLRYASQALEGRTAYGRWGTANGFPVLYLARPRDSVVVEAYRHLVDPIGDEAIAAQIQPRVLVTCEVHVSNVLDLRQATTRVEVGLPLTELRSATGDRESYAACQRVAQVAHQLGYSGVIAPAATQLGDTLALFTDRLDEREWPVKVTEDEVWNRLPPDPRAPETGARLRVVGGDDPTN